MFTPIDLPDALNSELRGINNIGAFVGSFRDSRGSHGLICMPSEGIQCASDAVRPLDLWFEGSKAVSTQINGLTSFGQMAGAITDSHGETHGFVCGSLPENLKCQFVDVIVDHARMTDTVIFGLQEQGLLVGHYRDPQARIHGFVSKDGNFTRVDVPGAVATVVSGLTITNGNSTIVGFFVDVRFQMHGFLCSLPIAQNCFLTFDAVVNGITQSMTQPMGINKGRIVGSFRDPVGGERTWLLLSVTA